MNNNNNKKPDVPSFAPPSGPNTLPNGLTLPGASPMGSNMPDRPSNLARDQSNLMELSHS